MSPEPGQFHLTPYVEQLRDEEAGEAIFGANLQKVSQLLSDAVNLAVDRLRGVHIPANNVTAGIAVGESCAHPVLWGDILKDGAHGGLLLYGQNFRLETPLEEVLEGERRVYRIRLDAQGNTFFYEKGNILCGLAEGATVLGVMNEGQVKKSGVVFLPTKQPFSPQNLKKLLPTGKQERDAVLQTLLGELARASGTSQE